MKQKGMLRRLTAIITVLTCTLSILPAAVNAEEEETEETTVETTIVTTEDTFDNGGLFSDYSDHIVSLKKPHAEPDGTKKTGEAQFAEGTPSRIVYDRILEHAKKIAAGEESSAIIEISTTDLGNDLDKIYTAEELGLANLGTGGPSEEAKNKIIQIVNNAVKIKSVLYALLADYPYEFYWRDDTYSSGVGFRYSYVKENEVITVTSLAASKYIFKLQVSDEYRKTATDKYTVDTAKAQAVSAAISKARSIVDTHKTESDDTKLRSYMNEIKDRVSYNHEAADDDDTPYGNPWQLIWVFDDKTEGNPDETKVVCEGYSKAFQLLCNLSTFNNNAVTCYTVSGDMRDDDNKGGGHMWNIVTMGNGKNYLVDVTNCDTGTAGSPDKLFMAAADSGSVESGYSFDCGSKTITYKYDSEMKNIFTDQELTIVSKEQNTVDQEVSPIADLRLGKTCTFGNDLSITYYAKKDELADMSNIYLTVDKEIISESDGTSTWKYHKISEMTEVTVNGTEYYAFNFNNIAAREMSSELHAVLYATKDGKEYASKMDNYSVKKYAMNRLNKSADEKFKTLLVDTLNYGAAAQAYFKYNESRPANADLTAEQQALGTQEIPEADSAFNQTVLTDAAASFYQVSVVFGSNTELKYYMDLKSLNDPSNVNLKLTYTTAAGTNKETIIPFSEFSKATVNNKLYYTAKLSTIAAKDAGRPVTAVILDGDTPVSSTLGYSIETYIHNKLAEGSDDENFISLLNALLKYSRSALAYFGKKSYL